MLHAWNMLYQLLMRYSIYTIEGKEVVFSEADIWKNNLELEKDLSITGDKKKHFFLLLERDYDMHIPEREKQCILTIGELKEAMIQYSDYVD